MRKIVKKTIRFLCAFFPEMFEKQSNKIHILFESAPEGPVLRYGLMSDSA
jgi:hypothetical protein